MYSVNKRFNSEPPDPTQARHMKGAVVLVLGAAGVVLLVLLIVSFFDDAPQCNAVTEIPDPQDPGKCVCNATSFKDTITETCKLCPPNSTPSDGDELGGHNSTPSDGDGCVCKDDSICLQDCSGNEDLLCVKCPEGAVPARTLPTEEQVAQSHPSEQSCIMDCPTVDGGTQPTPFNYTIATKNFNPSQCPNVRRGTVEFGHSEHGRSPVTLTGDLTALFSCLPKQGGQFDSSKETQRVTARTREECIGADGEWTPNFSAGTPICVSSSWRDLCVGDGSTTAIPEGSTIPMPEGGVCPPGYRFSKIPAECSDFDPANPEICPSGCTQIEHPCIPIDISSTPTCNLEKDENGPTKCSEGCHLNVEEMAGCEGTTTYGLLCDLDPNTNQSGACPAECEQRPGVFCTSPCGRAACGACSNSGTWTNIPVDYCSSQFAEAINVDLSSETSSTPADICLGIAPPPNALGPEPEPEPQTPCEYNPRVPVPTSEVCEWSTDDSGRANECPDGCSTGYTDTNNFLSFYRVEGTITKHSDPAIAGTVMDVASRESTVEMDLIFKDGVAVHLETREDVCTGEGIVPVYYEGPNQISSSPILCGCWTPCTSACENNQDIFSTTFPDTGRGESAVHDYYGNQQWLLDQYAGSRSGSQRSAWQGRRYIPVQALQTESNHICNEPGFQNHPKRINPPPCHGGDGKCFCPAGTCAVPASGGFEIRCTPNDDQLCTPVGDASPYARADNQCICGQTELGCPEKPNPEHACRSCSSITPSYEWDEGQGWSDSLTDSDSENGGWFSMPIYNYDPGTALDADDAPEISPGTGGYVSTDPWLDIRNEASQDLGIDTANRIKCTLNNGMEYPVYNFEGIEPICVKDGERINLSPGENCTHGYDVCWAPAREGEDPIVKEQRDAECKLHGGSPSDCTGATLSNRTSAGCQFGSYVCGGGQGLWGKRDGPHCPVSERCPSEHGACEDAGGKWTTRKASWINCKTQYGEMVPPDVPSSIDIMDAYDTVCACPPGQIFEGHTTNNILGWEISRPNDFKFRCIDESSLLPLDPPPAYSYLGWKGVDPTGN